LTDDELTALITAALATTGAQAMSEMSKVMAIVRPQVQGRADMATVSALIKQRLSG
jgi:uncharacterized protein YqeY